MKENKVVIIGSGIAGMTAAIYLKRGGLEPIIIENNAPGGMLNIIPNIENYPGYISIAGPDLAMNIYNQVNELGIKYLYKNIKNISLKEKTIDNEIDIAVQVNGKVRDTIRIKKDSSKEELEKLAMDSEIIKKWLEGKEIVKVICVPNRIVNIVIR